MVSEEMDFAVSVVNLDDQAEAPSDDPLTNVSDDNDDKNSQHHQQHVSPSDRFTDDYDRGYLHTRRRHDDLYNANPARGSYRQQDRFNHHPHHHDSYSNSNDHRPSYGKWNADRRGSGHTATHRRRSSNGSNHSGASGSTSATSPQQRRPSQERSPPTITTLLRRPHDTTTTANANDASLYAASSKDDRPPDIVAAQRKAMTTAAEMAKKRREADEAERQAAAERARQKALALAPPPQPVEEKPKAPVTILTHARKVSHGTIITTTTADTGTSHLLQESKELTEDEKSWADYVNKLKESDSKKGSGAKQEDEDKKASTTTVTDWSSYADRLQHADELKEPKTLPHDTGYSAITDVEGKERQRQQKVSEAPSSPCQEDEPVPTTITTEQPSQQAPTGEYNKNNNSNNDTARRFIKSSSKLRLANYPLFPDTIGRKVPPKPASLHFMIDQAESDDELMVTVKRQSDTMGNTELTTFFH